MHHCSYTLCQKCWTCLGKASPVVIHSSSTSISLSLFVSLLDSTSGGPSCTYIQSHRCIPPDQFPGTGCRMPCLIKITGHRGEGVGCSFRATSAPGAGRSLLCGYRVLHRSLLFFFFFSHSSAFDKSLSSAKPLFPPWLLQQLHGSERVHQRRYPSSATAYPPPPPPQFQLRRARVQAASYRPQQEGHAEPGRADGEKRD